MLLLCHSGVCRSPVMYIKQIIYCTHHSLFLTTLSPDVSVLPLHSCSANLVSPYCYVHKQIIYYTSQIWIFSPLLPSIHVVMHITMWCPYTHVRPTVMYINKLCNTQIIFYLSPFWPLSKLYCMHAPALRFRHVSITCYVYKTNNILHSSFIVSHHSVPWCICPASAFLFCKFGVTILLCT
jgi:hypothetical protein